MGYRDMRQSLYQRRGMCMASGSRVRLCGQGLRPRLNASPCLWRTAPMQCRSISCGAIQVLTDCLFFSFFCNFLSLPNPVTRYDIVFAFCYQSLTSHASYPSCFTIIFSCLLFKIMCGNPKPTKNIAALVAIFVNFGDTYQHNLIGHCIRTLCVD